MINVVWVNYTYNDRRGPNKRFLELVIGLNGLNEDMKHIAVFPEAPEDANMVKMCEENNVEYHFCNICWFKKLTSPNIEVRKATFRQFIENVNRLTEILINTKCDLVISNTTLVWETGFAAKRLGIKHIRLIKGILNPYDFETNEISFEILRALEKALINQSDYFVTHSSYTAKLWNIDCNAKYYKCIPLGAICNDKWVPLELKSPLKIVTFASIEENKNIEYIVEIAKELKQRKIDCEFSIYGHINNIKYKRKIDETIRNEELTSSVHIYDYQQNIDEIYNDNHIVFISSMLETFGATVIEGMARCRPVISVKCGGPEEIIEDGVSGFLIDAFHPKEAADQFAYFINFPDKLVEFGMNGRKRWLNDYTIDVSLNSWHKFLLEVYEDPRKKIDHYDLDEMNQFMKLLKIGETYAINSDYILISNKSHINSKNCQLKIVTNLHPTNASLRVGLLNSLDYLVEHNLIKYEIAKPEEIKEIEKGDVLIFVRTLESNAYALFQEAQELGIKTIYYADDCLFKIPEHARNSQHYNDPDVQEILAKFIENVDQVVCSSEWLSQAYSKKYQINSTWIQPAIDRCSYPIVKKNRDELVVGFAGNVDHTVSLEALRETFIKLQYKYGKKIRFEFIGAKPSFLSDIESLYFPPMSYSNYESLMARRCWDIGIAYLEDTEFNNLKCFNKFLEYSKYHIAGVYSNIQLYQRIIETGYNGLLANPHYYDWYEKLDWLLKSRILREKIVKNAYKKALSLYGIKEGAKSINNQLIYKKGDV